MRKRNAKKKIRDDTAKRKPKPTRRRAVVNKKVRNAKVTVRDGVTFRSGLEAFAHDLLIENNIPHTYEETIIQLIPPFVYGDEKIRAATYKPDFVGDGWIMEIKGFATDVFKLRWKLFKYTLAKQGIHHRLYLPRNQQEVREAIQDILSNMKT